MSRVAAAILLMAAAAGPAVGQSPGGWTLGEQTLEDGSRAIVLSRQQARGRAEYRVLHHRRREAGVHAENCSYGNSSNADAEAIPLMQKSESPRG